jgi:hypothetical protein
MPSAAIASRQRPSWPASPANPGREQMHHVERGRWLRHDPHAGRQRADHLGIVDGQASRKNAKARLDAELLHN